MVQLTKQQQAQYERDGFVFPLRAFDDAEIASFKTKLDGVIAREGGELSKRTNQKPHLLLPFLNGMMRDARILDAVEGAIGPNILAWASGFFIKQPSSKSFISWHQDSTYWGLSSPDVITAWIAFTPSIPLSGCMRVVAGSHLHDQIPHRDTHAAENMLSRGQEVAVEVDDKQAVDIVLQPGEFSLHHVRLIHGSEPNRASWPRIGYVVRYIPTYVRQLSGVRDSATLVRGVDTYHHFDPEPTPQSDYHPEAVAFHDEMLKRTTQILYAGAKKVREFEPLRTGM